MQFQVNAINQIAVSGSGEKKIVEVELKELDAEGSGDVADLLSHYAEELRATGQDEEAKRMLSLASDAPENFLMVVPHRVQADPSISTE